MKKSFIITYDYELFLGSNSGSLREALIIPTERLLKIHERFQTKAVFFVDTCYLIRLSEQSKISELAKVDFEQISAQLREMAKNHDIYLHLHPHWLDAVYNSEFGTWNLSNHTRYTFEGFSDTAVFELFRKSLDLLREILCNPGYVSEGYRAGGWSIQPFSKFRESFLAVGITKDYSVIPGKMYHSTAQKFDYLSAPLNKISYSFSDCPSKEDKSGRFSEFPISVYSISPLVFLIRKNYLRVKSRLVMHFKKSKGSTVGATMIHEKSLYSKRTFVAQIENLDFFLLSGIFKKLKIDSYIHFVSHPKLMTSFDFFALKLILKHGIKR